jgi:hypothetical protein
MSCCPTSRRRWRIRIRLVAQRRFPTSPRATSVLRSSRVSRERLRLSHRPLLSLRKRRLHRYQLSPLHHNRPKSHRRPHHYFSRRRETHPTSPSCRRPLSRRRLRPLCLNGSTRPDQRLPRLSRRGTNRRRVLEGPHCGSTGSSYSAYLCYSHSLPVAWDVRSHRPNPLARPRPLLDHDLGHAVSPRCTGTPISPVDMNAFTTSLSANRGMGILYILDWNFVQTGKRSFIYTEKKGWSTCFCCCG